MTRGGITILLCALLLQAPATRAAQLGKDECAKFKTEQEEMEKAGVRGSMAKGVMWAKTNLAPDKLEQIRRLIELDEQLLFRCGGKPLVELPVEAEADPAAMAAENKKAENEPSSPETPAAVPAAKAAGADKADKGAKEKKKAAAVSKGEKAAEPTAGGEPKKVEPKAKAPAKVEKAPPVKAAKEPAKEAAKEAGGDSPAAKAAKAKAKADDAYRPPPPTQPGSDPFANQAAPPPKH